jgi:hypothetical protein
MRPSRTLLAFRCRHADDDFFQHGADVRREIEPAAVPGEQDRPVAPSQSECGFECSESWFRALHSVLWTTGEAMPFTRQSVDLIFMVI